MPPHGFLLLLGIDVSFKEVHDTVAEKLELLNDKSFKARKGCRRSTYEEEELEFMQLLPPTPYEPATWRNTKVQNDYTVTDGLNRYSVPFDLIGECVDIHITRDTVEIYFHGGYGTSHVRLKKAQRDCQGICQRLTVATLPITEMLFCRGQRQPGLLFLK